MRLALLAALLLAAAPAGALERVEFAATNGDRIAGIFARPAGSGPG